MGHVQGAEVEKTFSAENQGKRVGWVRVKEREDSPFIAIDVVTAEVAGDDGAELGNWFWKDEATNEPSTGRFATARGFGRVAAFSATMSREHDPREEFNFSYIAEGMTYAHYRPTVAGLLEAGTGYNRNVEDAEKVWANSSGELLATMQDILIKLDFKSAYEVMYYLINGAIGRDYPMASELSHVDPRELLMPDPAMRETTRGQLAHLATMSSAYSESMVNDMNMRHRITGFIDDTPQENIPNRFIESRKKAAHFEERIHEASEKLIVRRVAYVPTGHGRAGRTWPYMDATVSDPDKAYGQELHDLHIRKIDRAVHALDAEMKELDARHELAREALQRFTLLSELENT